MMINGTAGLSFLSELFKFLVGNIRAATVCWGYENAAEAEFSGDK
jgi:hypothetical protein